MGYGLLRHSHRRKHASCAIAERVTHYKADVVFSRRQFEFSSICQAIMLYLLQACRL